MFYKQILLNWLVLLSRGNQLTNLHLKDRQHIMTGYDSQKGVGFELLTVLLFSVYLGNAENGLRKEIML